MAQRTAELRLDEAQWARILAQSGAPPPKAPMPQDGKSAQQQQALYLLVLEGDAPDANWKWWESALDAVVQTMQPTPAMTHSELLIPPEHEADDMHFAVYLGKNANWGRAFAGGAKFYLDPNGNAKSWRAIPIMGQDAVERVRRECDKHRETPYGSAYRLFNYPFSVPPLRSFAWMLDDAPGAPAHCASLVARCLRRSMPELNLTNASAWYGPSTLFLELTRKARMASYSRILEEEETVQSIAETEDAARAAEALLRGSDDTVRALTDADCRIGVDLLCKKCITAANGNDATVERLAQKQLARGLLRWSQVARKPAPAANLDTAASDPPLVPDQEESRPPGPRGSREGLTAAEEDVDSDSHGSFATGPGMFRR